MQGWRVEVAASCLGSVCVVCSNLRYREVQAIVYDMAKCRLCYATVDLRGASSSKGEWVECGGPNRKLLSAMTVYGVSRQVASSTVLSDPIDGRPKS